MIMGRSNRSNKHRGTVIEIYESGAAVKFYCHLKRGERIEYVLNRGQIKFELGQTGMVDYVRALNGYEWIFTPSKDCQ